MPASPSLAARAEAVLNQLAQVEAQEADRQARLEIENGPGTGEQRAALRRPGRDPGAGGVRRRRRSGHARPDPSPTWPGADGACGQPPRPSSGHLST